MYDFKQAIKKNFWGQYMISCLHCIESKVQPWLIPDLIAVKRYYRRCTGKELNLEEPHSFAEKLNWYKLNGKIPLMQKCADKVAVRDYVRDCGYADILNEVYGVYDHVSQIKVDSLPNQFVMKAAHGSHMGYIVKDKSCFNWKQAKLMMHTWLHQNIFWSGREWVYKDMPKRIIIEKYLEDDEEEIKDYKFFCFNGNPTYLQYDSGRYSGEHIRNFYDMELNRLDITDDSTISKDIVLPVDKNIFSKMVNIARKLSEPFQFVRVDLYFVNKKIYFGELTFFDGGGYSGFINESDDIMFGEPWKLVK